MKFSLKQILSFALALAMVLGMIPAMGAHVHAASTKDFANATVADLGISATDATSTGNKSDHECTWFATGNTIQGSLVGALHSAGIKNTYQADTTTLTLTNNKSIEAELSFKYSVTTKGDKYGTVTVNGVAHTSSAADQTVSVILGAGESITIILSVAERTAVNNVPEANGASISISDIRLAGQGNVTITFGEAENGSYTVLKSDNTPVTVPGTVDVTTTDRLTLTATAAEGYVFAGWHDAISGTYLSADQVFTTFFEADATVTPKFMKVEAGVYGVGDAIFTDLTAALQAAAGSAVKVVVVLQNTTLTGTHTIPAGVTLLIPYDDEHILNTTDPKSIADPGTSGYVKPTAFRTLTMADGAVLIVNGAISVNARHLPCVGGQTYGGAVYKTYGEIKMQGAAKIVLNNGANLYAWGYIWGSGTVEALDGATVYEKMQVADYRGGSFSASIASRNGEEKTDGAFPFNQYYIQNVEVKEIIHAGATLMVHTAVNLAGEEPVGASVKFVGPEGAMFSVMDGQLTKEYIPSTDRLSLTIDGDENTICMINGLSLSMGGMDLNSANFTLPINGNIDININGGVAVVDQELVLQPGVYVHVGAEAMLANNANIYIMDIDQWGEFVFQGKRQQVVAYSPSLGGTSNRTISTDAVLDIDGYVIAIGGVYTTAGGATIKGTGVIEFAMPAAEDGLLYQLVGGDTLFEIDVTSAKLTNAAEGKPFTETKGAMEGDIFFSCPECDTWHKETDACYVATYTITWMNGNQVLYTEEVAHGVVPGFVATNEHPMPEKTKDAEHHYVFAGWATEENGVALETLPAATANATYYVVFTPVAHTYDQEGNKCICGAEKPHVCAENLTEHKAVTPDCQTVGNTAYWSCTCGKFYADAAATQEIAKDSWILGKGDHAFTQKLRGELKTPGNCTAEAIYAAKCDNCDFESETETVKGEKDASMHTGTVVYTNNGENHSAVYNCCEAVYVTNEAHKYEDATYECICGAVYSGIYTDANGDKFFVVEGEAIANKGLVRVFENGEAKYYYFGCAANDSHEGSVCDPYKAQKNGVHWVENTNDLLPAWDYTFGADCAIVYDDELNNNEDQSHKIVTYGDEKYYTIDGIKVHMGLIKVEGAYYYVRSNGALVCGQSYWVSETNGLLPEGRYTFDAEGKMVDAPELPEVEEGYTGIEGGYYYVNGVLTYAGLIENEGNYYYIRSNGQVATGTYWITKTNGLMEEGNYDFDDSGVMLNPKLLPEVDENATGVVGGYYFENGVLNYAGLIKLDGAYYYVRTNGQVAVGSYWITKTNGLLPEGRYTFDAEGKMVDAPELPEVEEGFTGIQDGYYYENGVITYAGLIKLDGKFYYVRTSGKLATGQYWITKTNDLLPEGSYNFGADGAMIVE